MDMHPEFSIGTLFYLLGDQRARASRISIGNQACVVSNTWTPCQIAVDPRVYPGKRFGIHQIVGSKFSSLICC
jgi:hypothetical protein